MVTILPKGLLAPEAADVQAALVLLLPVPWRSLEQFLTVERVARCACGRGRGRTRHESATEQVCLAGEWLGGRGWGGDKPSMQPATTPRRGSVLERERSRYTRRFRDRHAIELRELSKQLGRSQ